MIRVCWRATDKLAAINSALEIDLSGQINAEALGSQQISGAGGISDFLRGAALAPGGRPIVALAATAKGTISRIVPQLAKGTPVTVGRNDAGIIVTEFGIADLRGKSLSARADALIAIAAPSIRQRLKPAGQRQMLDHLFSFKPFNLAIGNNRVQRQSFPNADRNPAMPD